MNNSTLGGLIKDYRLQKGISQLDISFALGWKEPSRLSRIEQGRMEKPSREMLDKIIEALGLSEEEQNMLLLTGGYLPTEPEILKIKETMAKTLEEWKYPAGIIDFSWRLIDGNNQIAELFNIPSHINKEIYKSNLRVLDLLFSELSKTNHMDRSLDGEFMSFLRNIITEFKYEHRHRTKEKWYIDHIKKLMDNELFRQLWMETGMKRDENTILGKYSLKHFVNPKDTSKLLNFYIFIVPVLRDPRFEVELHVPMDIETFNYYQ